MNFFTNLINFSLEKNMGIYNLTDEFFCLLLNHISITKKKNILVVVNSLYEANQLYNYLSCYHENTLLFPMDDFLTSEVLASSPDLRINRLETLNRVVSDSNHSYIIITNLMGYLRFLPTNENYLKSFINLHIGDNISPKDLVDRLILNGYSRDTIVNKTGEFAVRGYIVDVYPIDEEYPIRIEFFDDEIESIRKFDSDSQKSISNCDFICSKM